MICKVGTRVEIVGTSYMYRITISYIQYTPIGNVPRVSNTAGANEIWAEHRCGPIEPAWAYHVRTIHGQISTM